MPKPPKDLRRFESLLKVVEDLRGPDGCPWDKEQTFSSLTRFAIEEAHELAEAIDSGDMAAFKDELGDLLLQVVLHSEIARQSALFDIFDVIEGLSEKMIRRHPHVFADVQVSSSSEVLKNWAEIKAQEKAAKIKPDDSAQKENPFDIPSGLTATLRAHKIGEKELAEAEIKLQEEKDKKIAEARELMRKTMLSKLEPDFYSVSRTQEEITQHNISLLKVTRDSFTQGTKEWYDANVAYQKAVNDAAVKSS